MIKRLFKFLFLLAVFIGCAWLLYIGMPALEKLTPSKTSIASTATTTPIDMLAHTPTPPTIATIPASTTGTPASIKAVVVAAWSLKVFSSPDHASTVVAWLLTGSEVWIDECQHGWGRLAGGPGWIQSVWLEPDVCGGEE